MTRRLLLVGVMLSVLVACSNAPPAEDGGAGGGATGGGGGGAGGGLGGGGGDGDAGEGGGVGGGGGEADAGDLDGGDVDAGLDGGAEDAGCGGAAQLAFVSAPQTLETQTCSAVVRVQLQDRCGAPVTASANVPLAFSSGTTTFELFNEAGCISTPAQWFLAAGATERTFHVRDTAPGVRALHVTSPGLDGGSQAFTFTCPAGQLECPDSCVPAGGCCGDGDCVDAGLPWVCNSSHVCEPPPCTGFPANCTTWDDRTAPTASRTITFGSTGYSPKCIRVTTTQDVTFSGSFSIHPLQQTCGPSDRNMTTTFGTTKVVRFPNFGTYGYRCANHPVFEQGAVRVP
ncbi:MAG: hypothetical protein AB1938_31385 [Myxococcota bacterium]